MGLIITESELKKVVKEVTTKIVTKKRLINTIYKVTHKITGQLYTDDYWQGVKNVEEAIASLGITNYNIYPENGGYRKSQDGLSHWKEYKVEIEYGGVTVNGTLNCHVAGTVEDPFSRYDMSLVLW